MNLENINEVNEDDVSKLLEQREEMIQKESERRAKKFLNKHKREISRLNSHAAGAMLDNNKEAYKYAIGKLRKLVGKEVGDDILETLWLTSRESYEKILKGEIDADGNTVER